MKFVERYPAVEKEGIKNLGWLGGSVTELSRCGVKAERKQFWDVTEAWWKLGGTLSCCRHGTGEIIRGRGSLTAVW